MTSGVHHKTMDLTGKQGAMSPGLRANFRCLCGAVFPAAGSRKLAGRIPLCGACWDKRRSPG